MGGEKKALEESISLQSGLKDTHFPEKIGLDLNVLNRHLGIVQTMKYLIGGTLRPVFDIAKMVTQDQLVVGTTAYALTDSGTNIDLLSPTDIDYVYTLFSVSLPVARAVTIQVIRADTINGPYVFSGSAGTLHVPNRTQLPLVVPANHFLRITVTASAAADGSATVGFQRIARVKGLGFSFL